MCKTCNIWQRNKDEGSELNKEEWLRVISNLKDHGIKSFEIFGGDALLRKDVIYDIVRYCADNDIKTYFPTNGNLCDRETVQNLLNAGLHTIYLSIDDVGADHDGIRGVDGTFERIKSALETFVELRGTAEYPEIIICCTISKMNYLSFPRVLDFLEQYPINAVYPRIIAEFSLDNITRSKINGMIPEPFFASSDALSHLFQNEEMAEFKEIIQSEKQSGRKMYIEFRPLDVAKDKTFTSGEYDFKHCHIATTFPIINPNGDVVPCPFFGSYVIGNLTKNNLSEIWGNPMHRNFIAFQKGRKIAICRNCNIRVSYPSTLETYSYYFQRIRSALL